MQQNGTDNTTHTYTYLEYYTAYVKPIINRLDIALKCRLRLNNKSLAELLDVTEAEIEQIRSLHNIKNINRSSILKIMENSSCEVSRMFQREIEIGSPSTYTKEQLAFVYNLDISAVTEACQALNINEITWQNMPDVLAAIPYESR